MTMPGENFPGAGLWSTTGQGPPSPPPGLSLKVADQPLVAPALAPTLTSPATRVHAKTHCPWIFPYKCCKCCGYDVCARYYCPCTCCRCCCWICVTIVLFVLAIGLVVLVLWKVLHPKLPTYNVDNGQFHYNVTGAGATSANSSSRPSSYVLNVQTIFDIKTTNPNTKIGIYYDQIKLNMQLFGMIIGNQIIPPFYDGYNVTKYVNGNMTSGPVTLTTANQAALLSAESAGNVPANLKVDVKVRIKIGHWATPQLKVELNCVISVDPRIASRSQITGMTCKFKFKL